MDDAQPPAEWSPERRRELRQAFEERRRRQVRAGQVIAGLLMLVVAGGVLLRLPAEWWIPAAGVVALAGVVFRLANWKCPACGESLPGRGAGRSCPGCGLPLE